MSWLKLFEWDLVVFACFDKLALWHFLCKFSNRLEELRFIGSLEVFELLSIEECDKIRNGVDLEGLSGILCLLRVDCCEHQVLVVIGLSCCLESGLDSHAWWTGL